jgi:hypothetical protein
MKSATRIETLRTFHRQVFTDGRPFPAESEFPAYPSYSAGHWEGNTLDAMGHPRSEAMHVTKRFHRVDFGHLDTEITFDDPVWYTRKFSVRISCELVPDNDIFEMFCERTKKDSNTW